MTRRLIAITVALAWLAGCGGQSSAPVSVMPQNGAPGIGSKPATNVNEMPEPPVVRSVNGVATVSLVVNLSGATGLPQFVFEQQNDVAPTIRVNPGDKIVMDVSDQLPQVHHDKYDMNIHFHGMGSSPNPPGDDVLGTLARPGESLHYVVRIPKNQEPGLYWYHPHVHGQTAFQVGSAGMSGAIIVNGLEHHLPGLSKMRERMIIVRAVGIGATLRRRPPDDISMPGMSGMDMPQTRMKPAAYNTEPCGSDLGLQTTLNGAYQPIITIRPGEKQFFRVINASSHKTLKLDVGSRVELVAIDGFALDSWPGTPPTKMERYVIMPPASRAEFVVTGASNGYEVFRTDCYDTGIIGDRDPQIKLATLRAPRRSGHQDRASNEQRLTVGAPLPSNVYTTALPPIAAKRTVTFSEGPNRFFINGKAFSMNDPPMYVVHTGTVEEWHIKNISQEVHDFHIHQLHFLVKEINGVKLDHPYWGDSVLIPHQRGDGSPGTLTLIMDFRDPKIKGTFLFHCHILDHEDLGMMAKIQAI